MFVPKWLWKWAALLSDRRGSLAPYSCAHHKGCFSSSVLILLRKSPHNSLPKSQRIFIHHTKCTQGAIHSFHMCLWAQLLIRSHLGGHLWHTSHSVSLSGILSIVSFNSLVLVAPLVTWVESVSPRPRFFIIFNIILVHIFFNFVFLPRNHKEIIASGNDRPERSLEILQCQYPM